ncbi:tRNA pseudouridine32 synthase/23S rRNA pseudouridine746 synthase [Variovorax boronicumulans]|uniref:pseudouridine synthase n=1 Tax=Variovorax boronicumulans TaxID=436515 RepID=UPI0027858315|nr:pseudouridine synthase [Variovorax boronicumulans]MDQ0083550.1 tRNA pseudouridine32 synthase/23S rRNA pseudouridine746 synthase [Variovorax boronicumulans]
MTRRRPPQLPLPTRDGVGPSCVGLSSGPWPTIAEFLIERFPAITRQAWLERIEANDVVDEHGVPVTATRCYESPLRVYYYRTLDDEVPIPFEEQIVFQDDDLLVVDKPPFVPVTPTGKYLQESLLVRLKRKLKLNDLVPMHRIDRSTSGLVLFSVRHATRGAYQAMFPERRIAKHYEAVVPWREGVSSVPEIYRSRLVDDEHFMRVREEPGEPNSETRIEVQEVRDGHALLKLSPVTGRKHQLRVHCMALGMPIVNDPIYPVLLPEGADDFGKPLQLLARSLAFLDPVSGDLRSFTSPRSLSLTPR